MNKQQSSQLGQIFVKWNIREISDGEAMYQLTKLFPRIFLKAWRKYCEEPAEGVFIKQPFKE